MNSSSTITLETTRRPQDAAAALIPRPGTCGLCFAFMMPAACCQLCEHTVDDGRRPARRRGAVWAAAWVLPAAVMGCAGPLDRASSDDIHRQLVDAVRRELDSLPDDSPVMRARQEPSMVDRALAPRLEELERMAGPASYLGVDPAFDHDLSGTDQHTTALSLDEAITTAVDHNLSIQIARIQPALAAAGRDRAAAAFDAVFFASVRHAGVDQPTVVPVLGGIPLGSAATQRDITSVETGVRLPLTTGGEVLGSTSFDRTDNRTPGIATDPDPAYLARITFGVNHPLMRGFGRDTAMSQIRLAENADRRAIQLLRSDMLATVETVEHAYWDLVVAREALKIRQRLFERGVETRDFMQRRAETRGDVRDSQLADAMATVERRRADLIRARRQVRARSDVLKGLINAPQLSVGNESLIDPIDFMTEAPLEYNLREMLVTALERRPEIQEALIDLDDTSIALNVADNARLPLLNFSAQMQLLGLEDDLAGAYGNVADDSFIDYVVGLLFEQPIGNRAAEAGYREARLRRAAAVIAYRAAVQRIVLEVKSSLRDAIAAYELIEATRTARLAASENLRAILVDEAFRAVPTPEFLNLKFQRQEALAAAELAEMDALASFNKSLAGLYRAMGVGLEVNAIEMVLPVDGTW